MGTHAAIGVQSDQGPFAIESIYCHYDGYLDHVGKTLLKYYNTPKLVRELIALGDISSLGYKIGEKHDFDNPRSDWCAAYHRDRNEPWSAVCPITSQSIQDFLDAYGVDYYYIFVEKENRWYVKTNSEYDSVFKPLDYTIDCYHEDLTN